MTIWRWRQKISGALGGSGSSVLGGIVEADEKFFRESRKGSREWVRHQRDPLNHPKPDRMRWVDYKLTGTRLPAGISKYPSPPGLPCPDHQQPSRPFHGPAPWAGHQEPRRIRLVVHRTLGSHRTRPHRTCMGRSDGRVTNTIFRHGRNFSGRLLKALCPPSLELDFNVELAHLHESFVKSRSGPPLHDPRCAQWP